MRRIMIVIVCFFTSSILTYDTWAFNSTHHRAYHEKFKLVDSPSLSLCIQDVGVITENPEDLTSDVEEYAELEEDFEEVGTIADPLESFNRFSHGFNDKLYFHVLKPAAKGYGMIVPKRARISVQSFFSNIYAPIRFINCGLQGNGRGALTELSRFTVNSTLGVAGFFDPAKSLFKLRMQEEDFGQTLGCFKGPGCYLNFPFIGPTSLRDGTGSIVDLLIVPSIYVLMNCSYIYTGARVLETINQTSLNLGEYEKLKSSSLDPYVAVRNAYFQFREDLIKR